MFLIVALVTTILRLTGDSTSLQIKVLSVASLGYFSKLRSNTLVFHLREPFIIAVQRFLKLFLHK